MSICNLNEGISFREDEITDSYELNGGSAVDDDEVVRFKSDTEEKNAALEIITDEDVAYTNDNVIEVEDSTEVIFAN